MTLVLTLEQPAGAAVERTRRVTGASFRIGRGPECDWVLPDPTRRLSKQHCVLSREAGGWWVTDTSTNGVHVGDGPTPLGRDRRAPLGDGARLRLGDYVIGVRLEETEDRGPSAGWAPPPMGGGAGSELFDAPLGGGPAEPDWPGARGPSSPPAAPPPAEGGLFDESWFGKKPLEPASHPARHIADEIATPSDHAPPDELSLSFLRPPPAAPPPPVASPPPPPFVEAVSVPPPVAEPPPVAAPRARSGDDAARLLAAFLEGAGVAADAVPTADAEARLRELGAAFRALTVGLVQLLRTRALLKREIGVEQTMIGATGNNPLKLAVTDGEAVLGLVVPRGPGYLAPEAAIERAFEDLKAHELAVIDGVQEALRALLGRFDPALLEQELADASTLAALLAGGRKAQYWELFKSRYGELAKAAEAHFLGEAGLDFGRAYRHRTRSR
ncbi:MAG TPA: type VI secretion system-associated FHA domain protein TagH [Geminicoccaceae bacterium]|nr:type VI secretion system-associated FHA domain protein TagH [Geminicoccaceae bacterium]